jgi:hypothetical protein
MKIGLDIHGVIDLYPEYLSHLATVWISKGYEVHIVTGQELDHVQPILMDADIPYSHFFSIVEYHKEQGTQMWMDEKETWWMDGQVWEETKGNYAGRVGLDIHFDDSKRYGQHFPIDCTYIQVGRGFEEICKLLLTM